MLTVEPKSEIQRKLRDAQMSAGHIRTLVDLRVEMYCAKLNQGSGHLQWYEDCVQGEAMAAGIRALADWIDAEIDDVHNLLSEENTKT